MAKTTRLSTKDVNRIIEALGTWQGKLTWEIVVQKVERLLGKQVSRQALDKRENIRLAFQEAKLQRRQPSKRRTPSQHEGLSPELAYAEKRLEVLKTELRSVKKENERMFEQFATWLYHARSRGLTDKDLNAPLPPIDRGWTAPKR